MKELFEGLSPIQTIHDLPDLSIDPLVDYVEIYHEIHIDYNCKMFKIEGITPAKLIAFGCNDHEYDSYFEDSRDYPLDEYAMEYAFKHRGDWKEVEP